MLEMVTMAKEEASEQVNRLSGLSVSQRLKAWIVKRLNDRPAPRSVSSYLRIPVGEVMKSRDQIAAIEISIVQKDLYKAVEDTKYSRLLIYEGNLDRPVGMLHVKDLLNWLISNAGKLENKEQFPIKKFCRDVLFTPSSRPCYDLLREMQKQRIHLAVVVDEHGGTDGLVSIEDLIEKVVGAIDDEYDQPEMALLQKRGVSDWEASARVPLAEMERAMNVSLLDRHMDVKTVGGLIIKMMGRVPQKGESVRHRSGLVFKIEKVQRRRIIWVHISQSPDI